jgi:hypothetical protein
MLRKIFYTLLLISFLSKASEISIYKDVAVSWGNFDENSSRILTVTKSGSPFAVYSFKNVIRYELIGNCLKIERFLNSSAEENVICLCLDDFEFCDENKL